MLHGSWVRLTEEKGKQIKKKGRGSKWKRRQGLKWSVRQMAINNNLSFSLTLFLFRFSMEAEARLQASQRSQKSLKDTKTQTRTFDYEIINFITLLGIVVCVLGLRNTYASKTNCYCSQKIVV